MGFSEGGGFNGKNYYAPSFFVRKDKESPSSDPSYITASLLTEPKFSDESPRHVGCPISGLRIFAGIFFGWSEREASDDQKLSAQLLRLQGQ